MKIRPAQPSDADAISSIAEAAYRPYEKELGIHPKPLEEDYAKRVEDGAVWVLDSDGKIAGFVILNEFDGRILLENLAVSPDFQGQGIGQKAVAFAEAEAKQRGYKKIHLYTHELMTGNHRFYTALGYTESHRAVGDGRPRVHYYKDL